MVHVEIQGSEFGLQEPSTGQWNPVRKISDYSDVQVLRANLLRKGVHSSDPAYSVLRKMDHALATGKRPGYLAHLLKAFAATNETMSHIERGT